MSTSQRSTADFPIWVIYDHPKDFPEHFVARKWLGETATQEGFASTDLEAIRDVMREHGLTRVPRFAGDDAKIIEVWL